MNNEREREVGGCVECGFLSLLVNTWPISLLEFKKESTNTILTPSGSFI